MVNVISYAYPEGTEGSIDIEVTEHEGVLTITLIDSGKTFDPTTQGIVDITAGLEDRPIGGLGIHLIRTIMDKLVYERKGGKNILTMNKHI